MDNVPGRETWVQAIHPTTGETLSDYEVSSAGKVRSWKSGPPRELSSCDVTDRHGAVYRRYALRWPDDLPRGRSTRFLAARLVLAAFFRPALPGEVTLHLNGDTRDDREENLTYQTTAEQALRRHRGDGGSWGANSPDAVPHRKKGLPFSPGVADKNRSASATITNE